MLERLKLPEVVELLADDAGEGGSNHRTGQGSLADPGRPQVHVLGVGVELRVALDGVVGHDAQEVLPGVHGVKAAPLPPPGKAMVK